MTVENRSILNEIGETPLVLLQNYARKRGLENTHFLAKLEYFNPTGSVKDRLAMAMIEDAEQRGVLQPKGTIVAATSGNTGISLAAIGARKGYHVILTMPETMSIERQNLLRIYGAKLELTDGTKGMAGAVDKALEIAGSIPDAVLLDQFTTPSNPRIHYQTTGPEIWAQTKGQLDVFVAGIGTGGTITGAGRYLKEQNPSLYVVGVEPSESPILSLGYGGFHGIQGLGAGFVPPVLDISLCDEILTADTESAISEVRILAQTEGMICGISSGAALKAACILARRPEMKNKTIVILLPDSGDRYFSTKMYKF
ncbi:MAG: cysteine synthase A [Agathobacter sp.]|nr:cysteine synthase A [Agathobacter sp.]